jgi:hypothetical protein
MRCTFMASFIFYAVGVHQLKRQYFNSFTQMNVSTMSTMTCAFFMRFAFDEDADDEAGEEGSPQALDHIRKSGCW